MQEADRDFQRALRLVLAARRCSAWSGDEKTESILQMLADSYRASAMALVVGLPDAEGESPASGCDTPDRDGRCAKGEGSWRCW
jgi:hypothetical protein